MRQSLIFKLERLAEHLRELLNPVPRRLHDLLYFPYQFIGGRGIRRTFTVIFMGFAYVVENDIPCFVCHMAEKIFFLYLTGFQNFQGTVCGSFGMLFQYHCPDSGQRTVDVMEPHGSHSIHIDFCVSHQLRKFFLRISRLCP